MNQPSDRNVEYGPRWMSTHSPFSVLIRGSKEELDDLVALVMNDMYDEKGEYCLAPESAHEVLDRVGLDPERYCTGIWPVRRAEGELLLRPLDYSNGHDGPSPSITAKVIRAWMIRHDRSDTIAFSWTSSPTIEDIDDRPDGYLFYGGAFAITKDGIEEVDLNAWTRMKIDPTLKLDGPHDGYGHKHGTPVGGDNYGVPARRNGGSLEL